MTKPYDLIALDWNGTLLDDSKLSAECISKVCQSFGLGKVSLTKYREAFRFPIIEYYKKIGLEDKFEEASHMYFDLYNDQKEYAVLFPGVLSFIEFCRTIANNVVVLTAGRRDIIQDEVINHFIDLPVFGATAMPSSGKIQQAQELNGWIHYQTGLRQPKVLLVGDTLEDWHCAKFLDWHFYAVDTGHCSKRRLLKQTQSVCDSLTMVKENLLTELDLQRN